VSSSVQAIVSYYGASNLTTILAQSTPFGVNMRAPALEKLLGAKPDAVPALAKLASPVFHVDANDPPLLLFHGDQDPQMPINQSHELQGAYEAQKLKVAFEVVHGAAHGGPAFYDAKRTEVAAKFLNENVNTLFHGQYSQAVEPFHIIGNIYYVGARNIASYLLTTPEGHIMIDTGTREMHSVIRTNVEKLGFKLQDVKILLSGHAHFDHVQGHAAMKKITGARVMAVGEDAAALESGMDRSPLQDEGWEPVHVDRVLKNGDTVTLGGTTLKATLTPGHTPGCTTWMTAVQEKGKPYSVLFQACGTPNGGVKLVGNPKFPTLVQDTMRTFQVQKELKPDIYLTMHPEALFAGKVERIKAGDNPHPLLNPGGYMKLITDTEATFRKRVQEEK
jgi:metallo-beta-lactamase class B